MAGNNPFMPPGGGPPGGGPPGGGGAGGVPVGGDPSGGLGGGLNRVAGPPMGDQDTGATSPPQAGPGRQQRTPLEQDGKTLEQQYKMGEKAQGVLDHLRNELDQLMDFGDMVRPEHVIEAAGRLVGHGIGAAQLAQLMSDMPSTGGEGLASWIRMHEQTVSMAEQQLIQENNLIRHRLGQVGIKMMAEQHIQGRVGMHMQNMANAASEPAPASAPGGIPEGPPGPAGPNALGGGGGEGGGEGGGMNG